MIYQKPLVAPLPSLGDTYDPRSGTLYPGTVARNQFADPFWVRSNREMLAGELLLHLGPHASQLVLGVGQPARRRTPLSPPASTSSTSTCPPSWTPPSAC